MYPQERKEYRTLFLSKCKYLSSCMVRYKKAVQMRKVSFLMQECLTSSVSTHSHSRCWWRNECHSICWLLKCYLLGRNKVHNKPWVLSGSWFSSFPGASLVVQWLRICLSMWETWVGSLGWEDALEKGKAPHSSVVSTGSQGVTHDWAAFTSTADSQYCVIFRYIAQWFNYTECMNLNVYI